MMTCTIWPCQRIGHFYILKGVPRSLSRKCSGLTSRFQVNRLFSRQNHFNFSMKLSWMEAPKRCEWKGKSRYCQKQRIITSEDIYPLDSISSASFSWHCYISKLFFFLFLIIHLGLKLKLYIPPGRRISKKLQKIYTALYAKKRRRWSNPSMRGVPRKSKPQANNFPKKKFLQSFHQNIFPIEKFFRARSGGFRIFCILQS